MRALLTIVMLLSLSASAQGGGRSAKERLIGAWHLVRIDAPEADGKPAVEQQPKGMLVYTVMGICRCS